MIQPTDLDKAYLAGAIDADGYLTLLMVGTQIRPRAAVTGNSVELHAWVRERWGGNHSKDKKCIHTTWESYELIKLVVEDIKPFLVIKKEAAEILLHFLSGFTPGKRGSNQSIDDRLRLVVAIKQQHIKAQGGSDAC